MPYSKVPLFKLSIKILLPLYFNADYGGEYVQTLMVIFTVMTLILLFLRHTSLPYYMTKVQRLSLLLDSMLFWFCLSAFIITVCEDCGFNSGSGGLSYAVIGAPFFAFTNLFVY